MPLSPLLRSVRAASVAEVAWTDGGPPQVRGVLPLVGADGPVLALPYAAADAARSLGAAPEVVLTLTDRRATGSGWEPLLLRCRPRLVEDREGDRFCAELLEQELLRHPPTRTLADSVLLRREHWWWLPRLLVELEVVATAPLPAREGEDDHLLVVASDGRLEAAVARVVRAERADRAAPRVEVVGPAPPPPGAAVLFGQAASPDFERWGQWSWRGTWDGGALTVDEAPEAVGLPPVPGVLARWRRQRALERACRRGLGA